MSDEKNCATCAHRYGRTEEFWRCQATGHYTENSRDRCGPRNDWEYWQPRRPMHRRIIRIFTGAKA